MARWGWWELGGLRYAYCGTSMTGSLSASFHLLCYYSPQRSYSATEIIQRHIDDIHLRIEALSLPQEHEVRSPSSIQYYHRKRDLDIGHQSQVKKNGRKRIWAGVSTLQVSDEALQRRLRCFLPLFYWWDRFPWVPFKYAWYTKEHTEQIVV